MLVAVDVQGYERILGVEDFYHGDGYWMQIRSEVQPHENLVFNLRTILYSANNSSGHVTPSDIYALLSFTLTWPEKIWGGDLKIRGLDIESQTVGRGLFIQEREFFGGHATWSRGCTKVTGKMSGTGAIVVDDDIYNIEASLFCDKIGAGIFWLTEADRDTYFYLFSKYDFNDSSYIDLETGLRGSSFAAMAAFNYRKNWGKWNLEGRVEARWYEDDFASGIAGQTDQDYVSYDQYYKRFTNAINVFTADDNAWLYAAHLDISYQINDRWSTHFLNEAGQFVYEDAANNDYYFFRLGFSYNIFKERNDILTVFYSNKVLTDSFVRPPVFQSETNNLMFREFDFLGVELDFKF